MNQQFFAGLQAVVVYLQGLEKCLAANQVIINIVSDIQLIDRLQTTLYLCK